MSLDNLIEKIIKTNNSTVVGLDPKLEYVPEYIKAESFEKYGHTLEAAANSLLTFNKGLIDALSDIVPAVKPQCAYYEMYGWQGVKVLKETIDYAHSKGMYVITDGKRNDIGTTMQAYSNAYLGRVEVNGRKVFSFDSDSLTVNAYLGSDGINPLLEVCQKYDKGIFVLVKTSNKSSGELQDRKIENKTVYEVMGEMCEKWGKELLGKYNYSGVGAVVGATYPEQLTELRDKFKNTFFLVPGYGAQGGNGADIKGAFDSDGIGAVINSSRGIMCAYKKGNYSEKDYAIAARNEAIRMRDEINSYIK